MSLSRPHRFLLPLTAFFAVLPLLVRGPSCGHDFDFHLLSWLEAATQYAHGSYPHWAYTPAYNAGEPRFLFYPPISWTLGALLTLALPIQYVATAYTFLALTLAGLTAHALARRYTSPRAALLCAAGYMVNPYMLFTAYERSAFAELLAAAWLPLLFAAALKPTPRILRIALPVALLWLTNAPAAVMGCYALAVLTLTRLILQALPHPPATQLSTTPQPPATQLSITPQPAGTQLSTIPQPSGIQLSTSPPESGAPSFRGLIAKGWVIVCGSKRPLSSNLQLLLTTLAGTALGLLLPAFYLLPAAYERRYVQVALATIEGMRPQDHFLFHRMSGLTPDDLFHNQVVRTASLITLLLLAAIAAAFLAGLSKPGTPALDSETWEEGPRELVPDPSPPLRSERWGTQSFRRSGLRLPDGRLLLPLTLLLAFLQTPWSSPLWRYTPQLLYLQFPWRLDALLAVVLLIFTAAAIRSNPPLWLAPLLAAALILPAYHAFHQPCDANDTPAARAALFHSPLGTEPTDEYTPATADNDDLHRSAPWWFACRSSDPDPNFASPTQATGQVPATLVLDLPCPALVVLNRRAYPTWDVTANGRPVTPASPARDDGLIAFDAPAGRLALRIRYRGTTDQTLGLLLSLAAFAVALLLARKARGLDKHSPPGGPLLPGPLDGGPDLSPLL